MVDPIAAVITYLQADSAVATQVSTRVFGLELPKAQADNMPRKCVVLRLSGAFGAQVGDRDFVQVSETRFDLLNYGASGAEAAAVWCATHDAMKTMEREAIGTTLLYRANRVGGPISLEDPDGHWPIIFESWTVLAAEYAIA